jgi:hypothetical protein
VFHGCTKRMKISRKRLNPDGRTLRHEDKILAIEIKRGWKEGTKITFPREGDESPSTIPADIVFVIKDKAHPHFRREGSDIVYAVRVSLRQVRRRGRRTQRLHHMMRFQTFSRFARSLCFGVIQCTEWIHHHPLADVFHAMD